jgi:hypothetical protein
VQVQRHGLLGHRRAQPLDLRLRIIELDLLGRLSLIFNLQLREVSCL